jgi:hypothetical protein
MEITDMPYVNKPRPYKKEYEQYQGTEEQKKKRAQRNAARAKLMKAGKVHKGDGMDVAHIKAFDKGGANKDGVRVESASKNRSFKRDSKRNLVAETSTRERKKK